MTTVSMRFEMVEVASADGTAVQGFRAYASDIGLTAEGTDLTTVFSAAKTAIESYLRARVVLNYVKGDMKFTTEGGGPV